MRTTFRLVDFPRLVLYNCFAAGLEGLLESVVSRVGLTFGVSYMIPIRIWWMIDSWLKEAGIIPGLFFKRAMGGKLALYHTVLVAMLRTIIINRDKRFNTLVLRSIHEVFTWGGAARCGASIGQALGYSAA